MSGLFERKMPLFSQGLMRAPLAGSFRPLLAGLISTRDNLQQFRPLNALISAPARAIGPTIHEGKEGEQHAEDLWCANISLLGAIFYRAPSKRVA